MGDARLAIALALALALGGLACGGDDNPAEPDPVGAVAGTITRIETGLPVVDLGVVLVEQATLVPLAGGTVTDALGYYSLTGIRPGEYAVFLYSDSLILFDRTAPAVQIVGNATTTHDVRLLRSALWDGNGYRIEGTIVDAVSGEPVADAFVAANQWALGAIDLTFPFENINHPAWAISDDQGGFSIKSAAVTDLTGATVGLWPIAISRAGYEAQALVGDGAAAPGVFGLPLPLPVGIDSVLTVEVSLIPLTGGVPTAGGALRGLVRDADLEPVADLLVAVSLVVTATPDTVRGGPRPTPVQGKVATTATDGSFLIGGLSTGEYAVAVAYPANDGYLQAGVGPTTVSVTAADTADAGTLRVVPAIAPVAPATGDTVTSVTPELRWAAVAGATEYRVEIGTGHILETVVDQLPGPRWQVPAGQAFADGDHLRWTVTARGEVLGVTTTLAEFETVATFTVVAAGAPK